MTYPGFCKKPLVGQTAGIPKRPSVTTVDWMETTPADFAAALPKRQSVKYFEKKIHHERNNNGKEFSEELQSERIRRPYL